MTHISNELIQKWLDDGELVYSSAAGRVGRIVEINQFGDVVIQSAKKSIGRGVTTFERGDEVSAMKTAEGRIVIYNRTECSANQEGA